MIKVTKLYNLICNYFNDDIEILKNDDMIIEMIDFIAAFDFKNNLKFESKIKTVVSFSIIKEDKIEKIIITIKTIDNKNYLVAKSIAFSNSFSIKSFNVVDNDIKLKRVLIKRLLKEAHKLNSDKVLFSSQGKNIMLDYEAAKNLGFKIISRRYTVNFK